MQDTDRRSIELKQQHVINLAKVIVWPEKGKKPDRRQTTGASKKLWKFWVDFQKIEKVYGLLSRKKKMKKLDK